MIFLTQQVREWLDIGIFISIQADQEENIAINDHRTAH